jgi:hypothetical protein
MKRPPSRYSGDGRWWWDGEQWQPVEGIAPVERDVALVTVDTSTPARGTEAGRRSLGRSLLVAGMVTLALIALATAVWPPGVSSPISYLNQGAVRRDAPRPAASATPTASAAPKARATPRPTATPAHATSPRGSATPAVSPAQRYRSAVAVGGRELTVSIDGAGTACAPPANLATCRMALQSLQDQVATYRGQLDGAHGPACMSAPDAQLRQALGLLDQGAAQAATGIDRSSPDQILGGSHLIQQAAQQMGSARQQVDTAAC